ncbi:unnamed protein product [Diamesa serratosioi]
MYQQLNTTDLFVTAYTFSIIEQINNGNKYYLYQPICFGIAKFYESTIEFARLQFILKDVSNVRTVYSIDFTRDYTLFHKNYKNNFGLMVKFNADQNYNETLIIANQTSLVLSISECFLGALNNIEFPQLALKMMKAENEFDVIRMLSLKKVVTSLFSYSLRNCKPENSVDTIFEFYFNQPKIISQRENKDKGEIMNCLQKFITEEQVEGVTFYRINFDLQADDKSCEVLYRHMVSLESLEDQDLEEGCMRRVAKKMNYVKRQMSLYYLSKLDLSVQQKAEAKLQHVQLSNDGKQLYNGCQIELFNAI